LLQFLRLRLSGFKSFVDPIEVAIEPGMTGVVGPNGCGKSNLVEAFRWVMGENSAKQMRGDEMDDVIFGGTAKRPPRNLAEVALLLDNRDRSAPAHFNHADELEVVRRIDRGQGSEFRVNGREVRARDVLVLFADAATGARSTAIVTQGRISSLINAKPADRRGLLEEAAGIGGLHSRRHEGELRLHAAEANLDTLQNVVDALQGQLQGLARQVRQATRYRNLSKHIREIEAKLLACQWTLAARALAEAKADCAGVDREVGRLAGLVAQATARQASEASRLPALRQAEGAAASRLQRLIAAREVLDAEESRLAAARREMDERLRQIDVDLHRESAHSADANQAIARLDAETTALMALCADEAAQQAAAASAVEAISAEAGVLEGELDRVMEEVAAADAERAAALRTLAEAKARLARASKRADEIGQQRRKAEAETVDQASLTSAEMELEEALEHLESSRQQAEAVERRRGAAQTEREQARSAFQDLAAARAKLQAEADALNDVLREAAGGAGNSLLDEVNAVAGYETALGVALGDDLTAPVEADAPFSWHVLPPLPQPPPLPGEVDPLARFVAGPPALARRLGQIGIVGEAVDGNALQLRLAPGQRVVSREGDLWRWDGYRVRAGAPSVAAARLRQRNRLRDLVVQIEDADLGVADAEKRSAAAGTVVDRELAAERQVRDQVKRAEGDAARLRDVLGNLAQKASAAKARLAALAEQDVLARSDQAEATDGLAVAQAAVAGAAGNSESRDAVARLRADLAEKRSALVEAKSRLDRLRREAGDRRRRLEQVAADRASWNERVAAAGRHQGELTARRAAAEAETERLAALPKELDAKRQALLDDLAAAEEGRRQAAARLADGEQALSAADRALKEAEQALAAAREERIRREAAIGTAELWAKGLAGRIAERLDLTADQLIAQQGAVDPSQMDDMEQRLERLHRDRDAMGPVNLRAEVEAEELSARIAELNAQRDDLLAAIAKLRQGIAELNREGRDRLLASFEQVDQRFRALFVRLFGGGRAHLALTESSDPLEAGLEIMASPPGKRLQMLSLLSGGEQALTALALLFAVFITNPAPICVLDEVDAPLDDANVDRFCTLVAEIAKTSRTRFMVVTHHRMTMARMDRLFGVTMTERGVSTLVSVDLQAAEALREPTPA
jgi:chromosome segregation protein